jgi:hypothetical protein
MSIYVAIDRIENPNIRAGTKNIIKQYYETVKEAPASVSGKYHQDETMEDHLIETFAFVEMFIKEFDIKEEKDILRSAALLHDIGNCDTLYKGDILADEIEGKAIIVMGEKWKYYETTGWSRDNSKTDIHPILSAEIIGMNSFSGSDIVGILVMMHMDHWAKPCPKPSFLNDELRRLAEYLCLADYLASRREVKIEKG